MVFMAHSPGPIRWHYRQVINALVYQAITDWRRQVCKARTRLTAGLGRIVLASAQSMIRRKVDMVWFS